MSSDNIITTKEYKAIDVYKKELKEKLMENIGTAQAVVLLKPTPKGEKRKRLMNPSKPKGQYNPEFTYLEQAYVSETLDMALMMDWDLVLTKSERIGEEAFVEGYIDARFKNGMKIRRSGFGGAVKRNNANQSWGDVFKAATSDLMKNCAARMGIGRDLYRHEEKITEKPVPQGTGSNDAYTEEGKVVTSTSPDGGKPAMASQFNAISSLMGLDEVPEAMKGFTFQQAADKIRELSQKKK